MSLQSEHRGTFGLTVSPDIPNVTPVSGYGHYYTPPEPSQLAGAGGKDMPLSLSFEIVEDEGIFISRAAAAWQGAIAKRPIIPLPARARAMLTGTVQGHVTRLADPISCDDIAMSHHMEICTDEVAQEHQDISDIFIFLSISATPGLRSWSFEELRTECYLQSRLATGVGPRAVPLGAPSWMIIPPAFTPYKVMT